MRGLTVQELIGDELWLVWGTVLVGFLGTVLIFIVFWLQNGYTKRFIASERIYRAPCEMIGICMDLPGIGFRKGAEDAVERDLFEKKLGKAIQDVKNTHREEVPKKLKSLFKNAGKSKQGDLKAADDPQYQTLAGLDDNIWGQKEPDWGKKKGKVAADDPAYQTLAGINEDVWGEEPKGGQKPNWGKAKAFKPADDPAYQTLAGINEDVWNAAKTPAKVTGRKQSVDAADPQYQTLAGLNNDIFD